MYCLFTRLCLNKLSGAHNTIQPLFVDMLLQHYLCKIPLFYVFVFQKSKHNNGLPGWVHLSFLACLLERGQLRCDTIPSCYITLWNAALHYCGCQSQTLKLQSHLTLGMQNFYVHSSGCNLTSHSELCICKHNS